MPQYSPRVPAALAAVDENTYTLNPNGSLVTQTTATGLIASTLDDLDVHPCMRVLEIGTGSGFSSALLSELVGPTGTVVTIDVVPDLVSRAQTLHQQAGRSNVTVLAADGHEGAPGHGPFDRVIAWTTPVAIPHTWVEQTRPGGLVVAPVELIGLVKTHAVVIADVTEQKALVGRSLRPGGYVEMHGPDLDQWTVPPRGVDVLVHDGQGDAWWLAGQWARQHPGEAEKPLARMSTEPPHTVSVFGEDEDPLAFRAWLYATHPGEVSSLGTPVGFAVGYADQDGVFAFRPFGPEAHQVGGGAAEGVARGWVEEWRCAGRPGWDRVRPVVTRAGAEWRVRAALT